MSESAGRLHSKALCILITGAGGAATPFLIDRLRAGGHRVIAADMDAQATGLFIADKSFVIPGGAMPEFLPRMRELCHREKVAAVIPLVDEELEAACELEKDGIVVLLPRRDFVSVCLDKHVLMQKLKAAGIGVPETRLASEGAGPLKFPLVVKPRTGRGSRGLAIAANADELVSVLAGSAYAPDRLLLQELVDGPEFTISVVAWRDGGVQAVVPKEIISKRGITRLAVTRKNPAIDATCRDVQKHLHADGPFNVQLRIDRKSGVPMIFEINPRFSTTVSLTMAAGIDEVGGLLKQAFDGKSSYAFGDWKEGVVLSRRYLDEFIDLDQFSERASRISRLG